MRVEGFAGRVHGGLGGRSQRRGWRVSVFAAAAGLSVLWALALAGSASAATPCGASGGATATCTYSYTGSEQTFTVPAGVGSVGVTAVGAPGGTATCGFGSCGGAGAVVTATVGLQSGTHTLYVEVGGTGQNDGGRAFNGGGSGGAGGGGASDVRTVSADDPASLSSRLVVGGGGGGGPLSPSCFGQGGAAGDTSVTGPGNGGAGTDFCGLPPATPGGNGGFGGTTGGTGGTGGTSGPPGGTVSCAGRSGSLGEGGDSVPCIAAGGGGGGGYYGGGAGGGGQGGAGGGGAGSSFWASDATLTSLGENATAPASVTITYTIPASTLAAQLVTASARKGPGKALADKAAAIQAAVNAGQTATACADITDYLGLVKAQTRKALDPAEASQLTADANNLAAALRC